MLIIHNKDKLKKNAWLQKYLSTCPASVESQEADATNGRERTDQAGNAGPHEHYQQKLQQDNTSASAVLHQTINDWYQAGNDAE